MAGGGAMYGGVGGVFGSGSCSSSPAFHGSRSMVNFGNVHRNPSDGMFYWPNDRNDTPDEELEEMFQHSDKKRRLTVEQVHLLEKSFEVENKLEPERKVQLAKDLGLQPRQVAIWFQNRRARWKTKQLEKEYEALKAKFDNLKGSYEGLLEEKEKLKLEVLHLTDKLLLKEGESNEVSDFDSPKSPLQAREMLAENSLSSMKAAGVLHVAIKQEDLSSSNSVVSDSDSPRYIEGSDKSLIDRTESSDILDSDQSDVPYASEEANNLRKTSFPASHYFLKQENECTELQGHCVTHGLPVEDESLWLWDY